MSTVSTAASPATPQTHGLLRVLGVLFGWSVTLGAIIGAGILRAPGDVAQATTSLPIFFTLWLAGALYAILGALSLAELGTMIPESGGQTVYARRAFGNYAGFAVAWADWISICASVAAIAIVFAESLSIVVPVLQTWQAAIAAGIVLLFMLLQWNGVRTSGRVQVATSAAKTVAFAILVVACFAGGSAAGAVVERSAPTIGIILALQSVIFTYDGWNAVLYMAGEIREPGRQIPRSILLGLGSVIVVYLLVNAAFVTVLGLDGMANSKVVADDAARAVLGSGGTTAIRLLIAVSLLSAVSANLLLGTRAAFAVGRATGAPFTQAVNAGGTPTFALAVSAGLTVAFAATGAFERVIAIAAFFFVAIYTTSFTAVFWLRYKEPATPRPYRAWGYPVSTAIALVGSIAFLIGAIWADPLHSGIAVVLVILSYPVYRMARSR